MLVRRGLGLVFACSMLLGLTGVASANNERILFASVGDTSRAPIGWVEFCADNPKDCRSASTEPRDIVMTQTAWKDLLRVNRWVNETVKPMTDQEHWGTIERWSYPTDGYGDCEDYVLLKRKMLI
ncbi:MAG: transglutaminase, partial [Hyphomicrobiales bacterium]